MCVCVYSIKYSFHSISATGIFVHEDLRKGHEAQLKNIKQSSHTNTICHSGTEGSLHEKTQEG